MSLSDVPLAGPNKVETSIRRVAILFAGGPAPAANAVISTAAAAFQRNDIEVLGIRHGYSGLVEFGPQRPMEEGRDYIKLTPEFLKRTRSSQGIMIGTARTNPGKKISHPSHLKDPEAVKPLKTCYEALCSLQVDALVSIGGDDTLKTANKMKLFMDGLPPDARKMPIVHLPKTIDNDYMGIDFTFGYFTAVETLAVEIRNLLADGEASRSYFLCEAMGRSAGWLAYGAAIAGEASLVISVEDVAGRFRGTEMYHNPVTNKSSERPIMIVEEVVRRIVATMLAREKSERKEFGVIVIAEGMAELLPQAYLEGIPRDDHGHIAISQVSLHRLFAKLIMDEYTKQTGKSRKVTPLQLGYEARCAKPLAYDVILGSQLGVGAYRALVEEKKNGVMVSASGQMELNYVPFETLVNPETLVTIVRHIPPGSDFHRLARFLETSVHG